MKAQGWGAAILLLAVGLAGAGEKSPYEKAIEDMLKNLDEIGTLLKMIDGEAEAAEAKPKLQKAGKTWVEISKRAAKLQPPERAEKDRLTKHYKPKVDAAVGKIYAQIPRVEAIPGGKDALKEISGILKKDTK